MVGLHDKGIIHLKNANLKIRLPIYVLGLFIMTLGIAMSIKSDLGVSPISSIPYTMTCIWGLEMGKATILLHVSLVLLQVLILRRRFQVKNLLQILVGILFGYFTTFCNTLFSLLPTTENLAIRLLMSVISAALIAFGIFLYLPANIMPQAGEGAMQAISDVSGFEFSKVKIAFDLTLVSISLVLCLLKLHSLGSVGLGTILAAILVGTFLGFYNRHLAEKRKQKLGF